MSTSKVSISLIILMIGLALVIQPSHAQDSKQEFLNAHNLARASVGVGPLTWDNKVAGYARTYANTRKGDCKLVHSRGPYGENILVWSRGDLSGVAAVNSWFKEKVNYDYNSDSCTNGKQCRHYTQLVLKNQLRLGCAKVRLCNMVVPALLIMDPFNEHVLSDGDGTGSPSSDMERPNTSSPRRRK
nr:pathogenesis-related protein 1-like [Ziziphus jujuba var. spinosa]